MTEHRRNWWGPLAVAVIVVWAWMGLDLSAGRIDRALGALGTLGSEFWPPDWSTLSAIFAGLVETVQIAVLATLFGVILSLPLAFLSANNLWPPSVTILARTMASAVRVLPSILWAIIAVIILGFGPLAGVAAMTLYTVGYLAKLQYEAFEGIPRDALEAVRAMGANRFQVGWHVVLPEAANALRSQLLFMFEYNVRSSTVIGIVGAGGIGQLLTVYLQAFEYDRVFAVLLVLFATVVLLDGASYFLRRRYLEHERIRWRDIIRGPTA